MIKAGYDDETIDGCCVGVKSKNFYTIQMFKSVME